MALALVPLPTRAAVDETTAPTLTAITGAARDSTIAPLFPANAAWLALAAICHNLTRAAGCLAGAFFAKARGTTIRASRSPSLPASHARATVTSPCTCPKAGIARPHG